jgi:hypothetical protein
MVSEATYGLDRDLGVPPPALVSPSASITLAYSSPELRSMSTLPPYRLTSSGFPSFLIRAFRAGTVLVPVATEPAGLADVKASPSAEAGLRTTDTANRTHEHRYSALCAQCK